MAEDFKFPTEVIDLPSRGWFYPEGHPLTTGQIELYYMTAKHEDILTSRNLIQKGIVLDKLIEALLVTKVPMNDLLLGDKAAIMIASRILGYGKDYDVNITCPECDTKTSTIMNLQELGEKESLYFTEEYRGVNEFPFTFPLIKKNITFKFLTHGDEKTIRAEVESVKKAIRSEIDHEVTTRLRKIITSVEGDTDGDMIRKFVDTLPARDAVVLREHMKKCTPDVDLATGFTCTHCSYEGRVEMPIDASFFWPNSRI